LESVAKRSRVLSASVIERRLKEGRGSGVGRDYLPWLTIHDVPSRGLCARIRGWTADRLHHLLSLNEQWYFYILDWAGRVVDIREQFPLLPLEETLAIAEAAGIRHPIDTRSRHPIVLTTDFYISVSGDGRREYLARTVKPLVGDGSLESERTLQKLEIEKRYWENRGIDWGIVTDAGIDLVRAANIKYVHKARNLAELGPLTADMVGRIRSVLEPDLVARNLPLVQLTNACDDRLGLPFGCSLLCVRHLIATRRWRVDMRQRICPSEPLRVLTATAA
jgi:hypothetical protein